MNGKIIKVTSNELVFGAPDRFMYVLGLFKYKPNNNVYVVYADTSLEYDYIDYASGHINNSNILVMNPRPEDVEIIKEYIYNVINNQALTNFEVYDLTNMETIEIIGSAKLEIKKESINSLVKLLIPVVKEMIEEKENPKKKSKVMPIIFLLLLIFGGAFGYLYLKNKPEVKIKKIICEKDYVHDVLKVNVHEKNTYYFNDDDSLNKMYDIIKYTFTDEEVYHDFIISGKVLKYVPTSESEYDPNEKELSCTYKTDISKLDLYDGPTIYEDVFTTNKNDGYSCREEY